MSSNIQKVPAPLAVTNDLADVVGQPSQMASSSIREGWGEGALASTAKVTDIAIRVQNLSKCYQIYDQPRDQLKQFVIPKLCRAFPPLRKLFPGTSLRSPHSPLPTHQSSTKNSGRSKPYRSKSKKAKPSALLGATDRRNLPYCKSSAARCHPRAATWRPNGNALIADLSRRLTEHYGAGFSVANLKNFRQFYQAYSDRIVSISHPSGSQLAAFDGLNPISYPAGSESPTGFHPNLSWSHYRALMRVENNAARQFYEVATKLCRAIPAMRKLFPTPQGFSNFGKGLLG